MASSDRSKATANYMYRSGTAPNTRAAVSQKNKVYSYAVGTPLFQQIGVLSEFGHDESRAIDPVRGVGYGDQIAELVPGVTEAMTLTVNKTLLYAMNLFQVFGYKGGVDGLVRSLRHHRWPFDIKQELVFSELVSSNLEGDYAGSPTPATRRAQTQPPNAAGMVPGEIKALITIFEGCWMNQYGVSYSSDAAIVLENSSVTVTDIIDGHSTYGEFIDTGLAPISEVGAAGAGHSVRFASGGTSGSARNFTSVA